MSWRNPGRGRRATRRAPRTATHSEAGRGQPAEPVGPIGRQDARQYNDIEATMDNDDDADDAPPGGAMKTYLEAVFEELQGQTTNHTRTWLIEMLNDHDWWIRRTLAKKNCGKLSTEYAEAAYYHDIYVWLPELRWGPTAMPPCVNCGPGTVTAAHCETITLGGASCASTRGIL